MCGIVGGISTYNIVPVILEGLSRLEYRGYDSVGIAVVDEHGKLSRKRTINRVKTLIDECNSSEFKGMVAIGHTRWATHGSVSEVNAHPHFSGEKIAVVHNGIIENYVQKRNQLQEKGYSFNSETDTEVIAHLIHFYYKTTANFLESVKCAISELKGAFAIGIINRDNPKEIICVSNGAPIVLGLGVNEMYFASDIFALLPVTNQVIYLHDGDIAKINIKGYVVFDKSGHEATRNQVSINLSVNTANLGTYRHYMQKEIFEQPIAIANTLNYLGREFNANIFGSEAAKIFEHVDRVKIIACGTSYNAGCVAAYWFGELANIECSVDIASEYRYRKVIPDNKLLIISISQSGETADTLACLKYAHKLGITNTLAICNVAESSLTRLAKLHVLTQAGPEIGVASTKAFTTQLVVLLYLVASLAKIKGKLNINQEKEIISNLWQLPNLIVNVLNTKSELEALAKILKYKEHALFVGRNSMYPIAMEGALKIKEISYIHAESYAAGELKHGPLALIDKSMPVILLMPKNSLLDKIKSNAQEILARQGEIYLITNCSNQELEGLESVSKVIKLEIAELPSYLLPIIYTIPLQLLAYYTALAKGTDIDKPRNLAKSVTVE